MKSQVTCENCKIQFLKENNSINRVIKNNGKLVCSPKCSYELRSSKENRLCSNCGFIFSVTKNSKQKYCSHSCSAKITNVQRAVLKFCLYCNKAISSKKFCNHRCQHNYAYKVFIEKWLDGDENVTKGNGMYYPTHIKKFLIETEGEKCKLCGWNEINPTTNRIPIQLDHINGNPEDNRRENVRLLCPSCHSLTSTFGILNKGNGRKLRYAS